MNTNLKKALFTKLAALGVMMLVLGTTTTWAADMCFQDTPYGNVYVGNNFSFPAVGTCKAFNGYLLGASGCVVTGTACSTNGEIRFTLPFSCSGFTADFDTVGTSSFHIDRFNADLPRSGAGYFLRQQSTSIGVSGLFAYEIQRIPCPSPHAPQ